ncbi:hypothetical protein KUCAC02_015821 [Chaenocephalus aceratus]|uniref:Uncharacterized protein n=1 Tax=Chaenocephalus aceratus TaxID=36190 RepID=A0ACB9XYN3_CHAAC|nr:hypothetical protein KUCAC02_015821 [Chaenocephalus aceratus]
MVAPRQSISSCCYRGMFLAPRLIRGRPPHHQACEGQGAGMGWSRQVDITGSFARTPPHILSSWTSGVGADVSAPADGQASVPVAVNRTGPLAWQTVGRTDVALPGTKVRGSGPALQPVLKAGYGRTLCVYSLFWRKKKDLSPLSKASAPTQGKDPDVGGGTGRVTAGHGGITLLANKRELLSHKAVHDSPMTLSSCNKAKAA